MSKRSNPKKSINHPNAESISSFLKEHFETIFKKRGEQFYIEIRFVLNPNETQCLKSCNYFQSCPYSESKSFTKFFLYSKIHKAIPLILKCNEFGRNIYFGVNPRPLNKKKRKEKDIRCVICLWSDIDVGENKPFQEKPEALKQIRSFPIKPDIRIGSGGGFHCYWYLNEPVLVNSDEKRQELRQILAGIQKELKADTTHDLCRVMRLPGTINWKNNSICKILEANHTEHSLEEFQQFKDENVRISNINFDCIELFGKNLQKIKTKRQARIFLEKLNIDGELKKLIMSPDRGGFKSRSEKQWFIIKELLRKRIHPSDIASIFLCKFYGVSKRIIEEGKDIFSDIQRAIIKEGLENRVTESHSTPLRRPAIEEDFNINNDFLNLYVESVSQVTDAPKIFIIFSGIALLSGILNKFYFDFSRKTHLNLYILLLAPSTYYRKTTVVQIAQDYLYKVNPVLLFPPSFTPEALYEILNENNRGLLCWRELIQVKEFEFGKDYNKGLAAFLTDIYDYMPVCKRRTKKDGLIEIHEPIISILAAGITDWFLDKLDHKHFYGGLWTRFLFVPAAEDERPYNFPNGFSECNEELLNRLEQMNDMEEDKIDLSQIKPLHIEWGEKHQKETRELDSEILKAVYFRLEVMLLKLAGILQISHDYSLIITPETYQEAVKTIEFLKKKLRVFFEDEIKLSVFERIKAKVLKFIKKKGRPLFRDILHGVPVDSRMADDAIRELKAEGKIEQIDTNVSGRGRPGRAFQAIEN